MEDSIRTGKSIQEKVVPGGYWKYLGEHPEEARLFDEADGQADGQIAGVLKAYDFSGFHTIVDVGGGRCICCPPCWELLRKRGAPFDLPHVTASAQAAGT